MLSEIEKTHSLGQRTTFVAFDQPLYLKARDMIASPIGDLELNYGLFCTKLWQNCEGSCINIDNNLDAEEKDDLDERLAAA